MRSAILFIAVVFCVAAPPPAARAEIKTGTIEYSDGETTLKGYLAYDDAIEGKRPGILIVPEWWGVNEYVKSRARQLAELGYVAMVADIYGEGFTTQDPEVAAQRAGQAKAAGWLRSRGKLALEQLRQRERVDAQSIAAIGYCFGGTTVLELARAGADLKGVVSFHGTLSTDQPAQPGTAMPKILVLQGGADPFAPPQQVEQFRQEMERANADYKIITYPGAQHSFTNPNADQVGIKGVSYDRAADEKSWQDMQAFFRELFGPAAPTAPGKRQGQP